MRILSTVQYSIYIYYFIIAISSRLFKSIDHSFFRVKRDDVLAYYCACSTITQSGFSAIILSFSGRAMDPRLAAVLALLPDSLKVDRSHEAELGRFLTACAANASKAAHCYSKFRAWRADQGIDRLIFDDSLQPFYPHAPFGSSLSGQPVFFDRLGSLDIESLIESMGGSEEEVGPRLVRDHCFVMEHLSRELTTSTTATTTTLGALYVVDLAGLDYGLLR